MQFRKNYSTFFDNTKKGYIQLRKDFIHSEFETYTSCKLIE